jgi:catechol 2,3-dioxygenase-like lactoylglutathione lyase family enzyme
MTATHPLSFWHHHGAMSVPDLAASIQWWRDTLGFEVQERFNIPTIPAEVAMLRNGPLRVELFQVPGAKALPTDRREVHQDLHTHGNKHISFAVEDVSRFAEELRRRGADIIWVRQMQHGSNIFMRDNAGNLIEFVQAPRPEAACATLWLTAQ